MDELLIEFCRTGTLGPLVLGMSPDDVVERIGEPRRIKSGQGDDCFQFYRYSPLELTMRCFIREPKIRRGAARDTALASITIELRGDEPLVLPEVIADRPIAAPPLRLVDAHRILADRGVEMVRDPDIDQMLKRPLDEARVLVVSDADGFVDEISARWRPWPGGWFYSEENETGFWVTGGPPSA
ncbi:hypothetical protein C8K30_109201 [Promicromonospora sp. AC04]|uniref:hypothetical protein n=1 Tax=Promicromonospora sp. AC04 TaxID=2135723 RepID=UPI000D33B666|nr:hypothetical protein [Promicromonospora sp. AC04]PUB24449.1 hypothetical protein C8K30_109201 [Promicromonospora sp. AC04]